MCCHLSTAWQRWKCEYVQSNRPVHTDTPDKTVLSCLVWRCELSRPDQCVQRRSVSGGAGTAGATAGRTPTQNALVGRSGRLSSHGPPDKTQTALSCRVWGIRQRVARVRLRLVCVGVAACSLKSRKLVRCSTASVATTRRQPSSSVTRCALSRASTSPSTCSTSRTHSTRTCTTSTTSTKTDTSPPTTLRYDTAHCVRRLCPRPPLHVGLVWSWRPSSSTLRNHITRSRGVSLRTTLQWRCCQSSGRYISPEGPL